MSVRLPILCTGLALVACSGQPLSPGGPQQSTQIPVPDDDGGVDHAGAPICSAAHECEQHFVITSASHIAGPIEYPDPPPTGGNHDACWGAWGVHRSPLAPRHWVHNLEHGGVVLLYNCPGGCAGDVVALSAFVQDHPRTLLTAYGDMDAHYAVVAWGYRLLMKKLDLDAVERFYRAHYDQGLESIDSPPPSGCSAN